MIAERSARKRKSQGTKEKETEEMSEPETEVRGRKALRESGTKEKDKGNQKDASSRKLSPSEYKRRQKKERKATATPERHTLQLKTSDDDRKFFDKRVSSLATDASAQLEARLPILELAGRDIHNDMATIRSFMKKSYFNLERVANNTEKRQNMCSYWNLGVCRVGKTTHTSGSLLVSHFCEACFVSANVLIGHPAKECPNLRIKFL